MKRTLKRFLPIILTLVIICSIVWYFLVYDRGLTQDILLGSARFFEKEGNHSIATWLYKRAYENSGNDPAVIIELAERFKRIGNYTQAEVVLSNAIKDNATPELFIALSKTYVEQDKLMDAVEMLDNITNPEIKAQLDDMRPSVPTANPVPGYYTEYLDVTIEGADGHTLYVSTNADYPSVHSAYTDGITLVGGENTIQAIAVSKDGLVSTPANFSYIVGGVIEEVTISDSTLDGYIRELLSKGPTDKIFSDELWSIKELTLPEGVINISSLSRFTYLENLIMEKPQSGDLAPLSYLTQLNSLMISGCPLSAENLAIIGKLPNLQNLTLRDCSLSNISGLSNASGLVSVDLSNNAINDLSPLSFLNEITTLNLSHNALTNISPLSALENLTGLDVSYNSLTSLVPLAACPKLTALTATNNQIAEIPVFDNPQVLQSLFLANNNLTSLDTLTNYTALVSLNLAHNEITNVSPLAELAQLVYVDISYNNITTLPSWSKSCALVEINAAHNKITSVSPLKGLMKLNKVNLDYNKITSVNSLAECRMLVEVSIYGNKVWDVSKLTEMSVIVRYNPV